VERGVRAIGSLAQSGNKVEPRERGTGRKRRRDEVEEAWMTEEKRKPGSLPYTGTN